MGCVQAEGGVADSSLGLEVNPEAVGVGQVVRCVVWLEVSEYGERVCG